VLPIETGDEPWPEFETARPAAISGKRIYAIGDVHGQAGLLAQMQAAIAADLARHPAEKALILYLGDLADRGPNSATVLQRIIDSQDQPGTGVEVKCLRGNHDQWLLDFCTDPGVLFVWGRKGGLETLVSYGIPAEAVLAGLADLDDAENVRRRFVEVLPERHKAFILGQPFCHQDGDYFFAHAGVDPDRSLAEQSSEDLTWIRNKFLNSRRNLGKVVVHGHTRRAAVESLPNRINVDTGAYAQQVLSCVILEGTERHLLQVGSPVSVRIPALAGEHA
jgi:serine/threonine protein phosphatase 1